MQSASRYEMLRSSSFSSPRGWRKVKRSYLEPCGPREPWPIDFYIRQNDVRIKTCSKTIRKGVKWLVLEFWCVFPNRRCSEEREVIASLPILCKCYPDGTISIQLIRALSAMFSKCLNSFAHTHSHTGLYCKQLPTRRVVHSNISICVFWHLCNTEFKKPKSDKIGT